ncbi:hypothetical protein SK128_001256 [Halocaridina rubra]|uniref:Uncharacterized protein n=1 Tax=Halocaridina rubra TaxID=373956 RepID=A0AAN8ZX50_HALRR
MMFYLVMMVVMSVVVAFILEAFTFRMEYNQAVKQDQDRDKDTINITVGLTREELRHVYSSTTDTRTLQQYATALETQGIVKYVGTRRRTRDVLQHRMYQDEIPGWLLEDDQLRQDSPIMPLPQPNALPSTSAPVHINTDFLSRQSEQQTPPSYFGTLNVNGSIHSDHENT